MMFATNGNDWLLKLATMVDDGSPGYFQSTNGGSPFRILMGMTLESLNTKKI